MEILKFNDFEIKKIIKSKRKTSKIEINSNGEIVLRVPLLMNSAEIIQFISNHYEWICRTLEKKSTEQKFIRKYEEGENFLFLGKFYALQIKLMANFIFKFDGNNFLISKRYLQNAKKLFENFYTKRAKSIIIERVYDIAIKLDIKFNKIRITSANTRWGSCNSKGNVNFSWRLIMAEPKVIDYVIIHEFCHLFELNHSKNFWNLVERIMPEYKIYKKWLDENAKYMVL
jgi:predicted metal-dependent hydrolase